MLDGDDDDSPDSGRPGAGSVASDWGSPHTPRHGDPHPGQDYSATILHYSLLLNIFEVKTLSSLSVVTLSAVVCESPGQDWVSQGQMGAGLEGPPLTLPVHMPLPDSQWFQRIE